MSIEYKYNIFNNKTENDDDEIPKTVPGIFIQKKKPFYCYEQQLIAQHVHFYISGEIGAPDEYTDMIHRIMTASPNDVIFIHLNTPGGRFDTGVQIINAMKNSPAKIVTVLESSACSMGTLLFLSGDEMIVNDHCVMMFHNFKGGVIGKGQELAASVDATIKWFAALARKIYIPFLSEEEFERIVKGEDIWMQSTEIRRRLDKMFKSSQETTKTTKRKKKTKKDSSDALKET